MVRQQFSAPASLHTDTDTSTATLKKQMRQLVQLRWLAVLGQLLTILVTHSLFHVDLPLKQMIATLAGLAVFNAFYEVSLVAGRKILAVELFFGLLVDMVTLTAQLYLSGGATNPFVFLYVVQVGLAAVVMSAAYAWLLLIFAGICFLWLADFSPLMSLPLDYQMGTHSYYVMGMFTCLLLTASLLVVYVNRMTLARREHDAQLAELQRRAEEEEHILRMGLLASGAAHELGTPLATIAVILGDWRHMEAFKTDPELSEDIDEIQTQVQRCKSIVSGILLSAGEMRGESSAENTVNDFFNDLVAEWKLSRKPIALNFVNRFGGDMAIASDAVLKQTVCNLLDNALEASPEWVSLEVSRFGQDLVIQVKDRGPGFAESVMEHLGQPYQSTKERAGSGLGLFLVFNVTRTLGGKVQVRNLPECGAEVSLHLPLCSLQLKEE
ncbi:HAMP domain-containing histidine kinase [Spongiibacter sp. KMU-158]|uniref:histidine kinase n=2 Tax=Spongiibacter pelagi TaxID=2760804 RepID=A0A927C3H4_9GAMM|nr:HAMP domain-containing histidine kinase [Spongiibacter pelagi]